MKLETSYLFICWVNKSLEVLLIFELKKDGNGTYYVEISGPLTPDDWKDARVALIPNGNAELSRPCIRLYSWTGYDKIGQGNVDILLDVISALKKPLTF